MPAKAAKAKAKDRHRTRSPRKPAMTDNFPAALERTRKALDFLAEHWQEAEVGVAMKRLREDASALEEDGFAWSKEVGLNYVLPKEALCCKPIKESKARDGLRATTAGGPAALTHPGLCVAPAPPCGFGVFATCQIKKGERLGEYTGEIRSYDVWCDEIKARKVAARGSDAASPFIWEELYCAWSGNGPRGAGVVIDAYAFGNAMRFINCSCSPSCTFKSFGTGSEDHSRLEVLATRDIAAGEQLSVDYGWYHDPATLEDIRNEAVKAYAADLADLQALVLPAAGQTETASSSKSSGYAAAETASSSEAVQVVAEAILEARGRPPLREAPPSFLCRFLDREKVARFVEVNEGAGFTKASTYVDIPDPVWHLYEVVGGLRVGVPCRCGLDPSLNKAGRCAGIIGRPLQIHHLGRGSEPD